MSEIREMLPNSKTKIEVVYAGGTISSLATPQGYREGGHVVNLVSRLEEQVPDFKKRYELGETQVAYTGLSENIDKKHLDSIVSAVRDSLKRSNAVVITHGTDSMEQTARYLQNVFGRYLSEKEAKVVITGANEDLTHPSTDAWDNLIFAFDSVNKPAGNGVFIAFHQKLIPAELAVKQPFNGREMNFVSRDSSEYEEAIKHKRQKNDRMVTKIKEKLGETDEVEAIVYEVNTLHHDHEAFLRQVEQKQPKAILLTLYHSGTANTESPTQSVAELVKKLREEKGLLVFGATENGEPVDLHSYETSVRLREAGLIPLYDMHRDIAVVKVGLLTSSSLSKTEIIDSMLTSVAGEIDENKIIRDDVEELKSLYSRV